MHTGRLRADTATVRTFLEIIHAGAARALDGAHDPGLLQLVAIHPAGGDAVPLRFRIGDVDQMVEAALGAAASGHNVYVEGRTVAKSTPKRGKGEHTRGVFAFVVDRDNDKGKTGRLAVSPSLSVETSPGNQHHWLLLERAMLPDEAKPIGDAIRATIGADSDTGTITQPYRVAGTPNFPGPKKAQRGRIASPTRIVLRDGPVWSRDKLVEAFPPVAKGKASQERPQGRTGKTAPLTVDPLVADGSGDRSERFFEAVRAAFTAGMGPDDLEDLMRAHPNGCASKYLEGSDRLRTEIERAWSKIAAAKAQTETPVPPTYPDEAVPVDEARHAVEQAIWHHLEAAAAYHAAGDEDAERPVHAIRIAATALIFAPDRGKPQ